MDTRPSRMPFTKGWLMRALGCEWHSALNCWTNSREVSAGAAGAAISRHFTATIQGMSERMIETRQLRRTFKSRRGNVEAVAGVDMCVEEGQIFGFLGPNGAGKTTTLRLLATLLPPTGGEATVAGHDLRREPDKVRRRIGYVGQTGGTDGEVSGRDELIFQARLYGLSARDACARAAELL